MGSVWLLLIFVVCAMAFVLLTEEIIPRILSRIFSRGVASVTVPREDAEALLGKWHKGWRLWTLRLAALVVIVAVLAAVFPRPRTAAKWLGNEVVDRAIDNTVHAAERRVPGAAPHSDKIRQGLRKGAERAYDKVKPK